MKTYCIHLIRHGLHEGAVQGRYIGHTDEPLSEDGEEELVRLKKEMIYPEIGVLVSSPLKRCIQTAKILYPESEPAVMNGFSECDFGEFEGLTADELSPYPEFAQWLSGGEDAAPLHGESNGMFKKRVCTEFLKLTEGLMKTGTDSAAVITHGGVIMTLLAVFGIPELPMHEWLTPCGCGYTVRITPSLWTRIYKFEVASEIPESKDAYAEGEQNE